MKLGDKFPEKLAKKTKTDPASSTHKFLSEYKPGDAVEDVFVVQEGTLRTASNGSQYVQATLMDKTGTIAIKKWDANETDGAMFKAGRYVKVRSRIELYQNKPQMIVKEARLVEESEVNPADFLPVSSRDLDEMEMEFFGILDSVKDPDIKRALDAVFRDEATWKAFRRSPAAKELHHAWIGGLMEHTLSSTQTAAALCSIQTKLRRDLLVAGCLMHDMGKMEEFSATAGFNYTDIGGLVGHVVLGAMMLDRRLAALKDFPSATRQLLLHMIASHHGQKELGAPVIPAIPEAVALHYIECMDAKIRGAQTAIERAAEQEGSWTEYLRIMDGRAYKG